MDVDRLTGWLSRHRSQISGLATPSCARNNMATQRSSTVFVGVQNPVEAAGIDSLSGFRCRTGVWATCLSNPPSRLVVARPRGDLHASAISLRSTGSASCPPAHISNKICKHFSYISSHTLEKVHGRELAAQRCPPGEVLDAGMLTSMIY